ncbi:16S rRNA (guanine(966)-N(2))-methyltransferase RsmD [Noviherbaspirillum humi]|uniref:16S rRNA (Guanine(966)-N(2))-methyltransferase RsmD n=1 Tax=Noviherbaspirillum humi TaxID=1688639 RepID=A0A239CJN1_9BURK|nr:16S rRNA (guanine(966)-N(2))-methyltransferase RsmD [Noviherbaspirillum humi]SNS20139.1 16S rRNA (guanine(966)-N(2))-methyltransferase RsmD [Noviherbaspirillum humi]
MSSRAARPATPARSSPRSAPAQGPHRVRIIGGQWKRTPLPVLDAQGLRPTPDRVRESVFNWLTHLLDAGWERVACLDAFAGTGALGFEAASRGAGRVVMVERFAPAVRQLEQTRAKLKADAVQVQRGDAFATMQSLAAQATGPDGRFDLIFLDPPYHEDWLARMLPLCERLLAPGGLVYAEAEFALDGEDVPAWMAPWEVVRSGRAGMVFYHLLQRKNLSEIEA